MILIPKRKNYLPSKYFMLAKLIVFFYFILWTWFLIYLYLNWEVLETWKKVTFGLIELMLTPNLGDLKIIGQNYAQYQKKLEGQTTDNE